MGFWILATGITLAVAAVLGLAVLRGRKRTLAQESPDIALYRDQLATVERDVEAGRLPREEAGRLQLEIKRRILDADRAGSRAAARPGTRSGGRLLAAGLLLALLGGTSALYVVLGAPGYPDLPIASRLEAAAEYRANRPRQGAAEARIAEAMPDTPDPQVSPEFLDLMEQLRAAVAGRPDDLEGRRLLVRNEVSLGNYGAAARAQAEIVEIRGGEASAEDLVTLAELWIAAAGGYVSPEAEAALRAALDRDADNPSARYYWALMHAQTGRADIAFNIWRGLREDAPADAPWAGELPRQLAAAAREAGVDYAPPADTTAPTRGPEAADIEAAEGMSAEDRQAMIRGMVDGLAEELATEGGPVEKWAQLIRALGVLGQSERRDAILAEARETFAANPEALAMIEAAAGAAQ